MLRKFGRWGIAAAMLAALALMAGCAATTTAIRYKDLDVQTKMSNTIFLDPVAADKRTIFVQMRNTSDKPFDIQGEIMSALMAKGYRLVNDPAQAHFILQGNVLAVGRTDQSALENTTGLGFGGVAAGAAAGALLG
ncbi:MAG: complement resistance protein TraT, partial [Pseudomonadota bacterium]